MWRGIRNPFRCPECQTRLPLGEFIPGMIPLSGPKPDLRGSTGDRVRVPPAVEPSDLAGNSNSFVEGNSVMSKPQTQRRVWTRRVGIPAAVLSLALATAGIASANLTGSTFEGNDGNLVVDTAGNTDWANAPARVVGIDQPSGGNDNSFGQGTKEDNANATVVTGSIPPNKNDLTRVYVGSEFASGSNFLYLAWERLVNIGSANLDLEINQNATAGFTGTTTGPVTLNRTAGDLLVTYDFGGSGTPTLGLLKWVTTGATSQCLASNSLPCWGNRVNLSAAGEAEGAVNTGTVSDPVPPGAPRSLTTGLFGEAAINLTAAGVFPAGTCTAFGSTFLKSRASASFGAEVKDFIAPQPINISNCGTIRIRKVTENGDATFGYTATGGLSPATFNLSNGGLRTYGPGTVLPGGYSVTESTVPAGWTLKSLVCTATGSGTSATPSGATVSITMAPGGVVDCTYTNHANASPTIATTLSANPVNIGTAVHDSSALTGATSNAGGTVTYTVYTDNACTLNPQSAGVKTVTNGVVPDSNAITFNSAGTFYWQAAYSGDANNNPATSVCTSETLVVNPNVTSMTTAQNLIPNDDSTLSGATGNAGGTMTFSLFTPSAATCAGTPALTQTVSVSGNGTYSTTNTSFIASAEGTWRWLVTYSGDANNQGSTSACGVEQFTILNH
jgi:hypothetical protein